jgi:hypothetical protein
MTMTTTRSILTAALLVAGTIMASSAQAQDERTTCASRPNKLQLLCSGDGCIRLEVAQICEALRRAPLGKAKRIQTTAPAAPRYRDLEQLIASLD